MIQIQIAPQFVSKTDPSALLHAAESTLQYRDSSESIALTVVITGDKEIQQLNRDYKGSDWPTDVLAFPSEEMDPDMQVPYLGDVVISYPRALEQALSANHLVFDELRLLVVHGVLHLLGYDHQNPSEKNKMWSVQAEILKSLGCSLTMTP
jgi:probable rRNA maturation factor